MLVIDTGLGHWHTHTHTSKQFVRLQPVACSSSPGGIWILAGSCGEADGSRGATATGCWAAGLGTVITTVLPGAVAWFMGTTWLRAAFVTCGWPLALIPPGAATFAITIIAGDVVCGRGPVTVEEAGRCPWPGALTLGGAGMESPLEMAAAVGGGCTALKGPHVTGTCNILTWTEASPSPAGPHDSSFWDSVTTLLVASIISEQKNNTRVFNLKNNSKKWFIYTTMSQTPRKTAENNDNSLLMWWCGTG